MIAWYKLKGLWDEDGAAEGMAKIQAQSDKRAAAIGKEKDKLLTEAKNSVSHFMQAGGSLKVNDKTLGDFKNDMMGALGLGGIADPKTPGTKTVDSRLGPQAANGNKSNEAIATGGTKHNYITINLQDLIGVLNIQGKDFKDSTNQMAEQSTDALLRLLAMASTAGG